MSLALHIGVSGCRHWSTSFINKVNKRLCPTVSADNCFRTINMFAICHEDKPNINRTLKWSFASYEMFYVVVNISNLEQLSLFSWHGYPIKDAMLVYFDQTCLHLTFKSNFNTDNYFRKYERVPYIVNHASLNTTENVWKRLWSLCCDSHCLFWHIIINSEIVWLQSICSVVSAVLR